MREGDDAGTEDNLGECRRVILHEILNQPAEYVACGRRGQRRVRASSMRWLPWPKGGCEWIGEGQQDKDVKSRAFVDHPRQPFSVSIHVVVIYLTLLKRCWERF